MIRYSLIICTYNRDQYLPQALESVRAQLMDRGLFELLIIDNFSTDRTAAIAKAFIEENPELHARYFFEDHKGLSFARNRGLKEASGEVLSYVDDDAILAPSYLLEQAAFFDSHPGASGSGGRVIPKYESGQEPVWMSKYLNGFLGKVEHGDEVKQFTPAMKYPAGCNMTYTKTALLAAGGFNNDLTFRSDDKYIFYKVQEKNDGIYYLPKASVQHYIDSHRLEFGYFKKLFLKTGNEEKKRILKEQGRLGLLKKFVEYLVKLGAACAIYLMFVLKGQEPKGRYVVFQQWFVLLGFLRESVFVR